MRVVLPPLEPGVYKVEWRVMSADTHKVDGDFSFTVGE
jgi:methionine-rich copper-binding protein CopC